MKQFIVLAACLPILLIFLVQFSLDQTNSMRVDILEDLVVSAKEEAKQAGCFSPEIQADLKSKISEALGIDESDILIDADENPVYRICDDGSRGLIHYKVSVPVGRMMAGRRLFGIRESDNIYYYTIESYAPSELLY